MVRAFRSWWHEAERWYIVVGLANLVLGTSSVLIPLSVDKLFDRSVASIGMLTSLVSLVGVLGSLMWGRLSDSANRRKPFIVLGYAAAGICLLAISMTTSFHQLALFNMLLNFFWVANASVTVLLVIENCHEGMWERKIGHLNQIGALGWVLGLAIGGLWMVWVPSILGERTAIRLLFWVIGVSGLVVSLLAVLSIPRTMPIFTQRRFRGILPALGSFISERARFSPLHLYHRLHPKRMIALLTQPKGFRPGVKRFFLSTLLSFIALGFFGIPLPMLLSQEFGLPSSVVFLFFMIQHGGIVLAYPYASRRIRKRGNRYVQMGALGTRAILFGIFSLYLAVFNDSPPLAILVAAFIIYGITWSYFQLSGTALTSRLASKGNRGMALGLYNAIAGIGWIIAGIGSGQIAAHLGYSAAFASASGLIVLSLIVLLFVPDPSEIPHPEKETAKSMAKST